MAKPRVTKSTIKTPAQAPPVQVLSDPLIGYVPGVTDNPLIAGWRALPQSIDDAERDFGLDIYDRMVNDPIVASVIGGLRRLVMSDGHKVVSALPKLPKDADAETRALYDECAEVTEFCNEAVDGLERTDRDFYLTLDDMLEALSHGHRMAEVTWRLEDAGKFGGKYTLDGVRTKPRKNFSFVVDEGNRVLGAMTVLAGGMGVLRSGLLGQLAPRDNVLPRDRMFLVTIGARNGDPRGRSLLRSAYNPWKRRQIMDPEEVKFVAQFAGGMITVIAGTQTEYNVNLPDGTSKKLQASEYLAQVASSLGNGGVAAFPPDTTVTVHYPGAGSGESFKIAFARAAREIHMAVATTARAFLEAEKNSKADADKAENVLDAIVGYYRRIVSRGVSRQVFYPLIAANWGTDKARRCTPLCAMSSVMPQNFVEESGAVAQLLDKVPRAMHPQLLEKLGLEYIEDEDPEDEGKRADEKDDDEDEQQT